MTIGKRLVLFGALILACGRDATAPPPPVASVLVSPPSDTLIITTTSQLTATVRDGDGNVLTDRSVSWASGSSTIASVSGAGLVTGMGAGHTNITATSEGIGGTAEILVIPVPVASVQVTPSADTIPFGTTVQLTATPRDSTGAALVGRVVTWASGDTTRATVSSSGLVTGVNANGGVGTIIATSEGKADPALITVELGPADTVIVTPAQDTLILGTTVQLTATPRDSFGHALTGRTLTWGGSDDNVASVNASGLVTANGLGTVVMGVNAGPAIGQATITVIPEPVATVIVQPSADSLLPGQNVLLTVTALDAGGDTLAGRAATWSNDNPTAATVSPGPFSATVTAEFAGPGVAHIVATIEGVSDTATITVIPPVATVTVEPATDSLYPGDSVQLTATARDSSGAPLAGRPITWFVGDTTIATVSQTGLVAGVRPGFVFVLALSDEGPSGYAQITVLALVDSVLIAQSTDTLLVGEDATFWGFTYDSAGTELFGRVVGWTSSNPAVATVDSAGNVVTVSGVAPGTSLIIATSEGVSDTATIVVLPVPVVSVQVSPDTVVRLVGDTVRLAVTAYDSVGGPLAGRPVTWSSSDSSRSSVDSTGLVTALGSGRQFVVATVEGVVDTAVIYVPLPLGSVSGAGQFTCASTTGGTAYCWGLGDFGNLGAGAAGTDSFPLPVLGGLLVRPVRAGTFHACGVASGPAYCWGNNGWGQLGTNSSANQNVPTLVSGGLSFRTLAAGGTHTCGLTGTTTAHCWGRNTYGQLGTGSGTVLDSVPQLVSGGLVFATLSAGGQYTCGVTTTNVGYCWGRGLEGQLGTNSTASVGTPSPVFGGFSWKQISAAGGHSCGVTTTNVPYCWGDNTYGALGTGSTVSDSVPVPVTGGLAFTSITTGAFHSCGLTAAGVAYCWGAASGGRLGNGGSTGQENAPVAVVGGHVFTEISAASFHTCGRTTTGVVYCWGTGGSGQLGNGSTMDRAVPVPVVQRPD